VIKEVKLLRQPGGWLRSSHSLKECVIAHWSSGFAPKIYGAKPYTEDTGLLVFLFIDPFLSNVILMIFISLAFLKKDQ
jgi:hypothetical protein